MDLTTILTAVISVLTGGGLTSVFFVKARKRKEDAEASQAEAQVSSTTASTEITKMDAMGRLVDQLQEQEDKYLNCLSKKDAFIASKDKKIEELSDRLREESNDKVIAQQFMCLHKGCNIVRPERGLGGQWQDGHRGDASLGADYYPINILLKMYGNKNKEVVETIEKENEDG